ncbi:MAG: hypothetical protein JWN70_4814 [Planctomycetaceae bacterium]|nr:hypothetical protein [Planctomycetaceae bacterium]
MSSESPLASSAIVNPAPAGIWRQLHGLRLTQATTEFGITLQSVGLMIATFAVCRMVLFNWTKLPEAAYFSPSILGAMCLHWRSALAIVAVGVFVWQGWSRLRWVDLDQGIALRCFIGVISGTLAWTFSVYDYNLYYDQGYYSERFLLVALWIGCLWRPVLIVPFTALVYGVVHQFDHPIACTWTDKRALFDVLSLFVAFLGLRLWKAPSWRAIPVNEFFYLAIILQAANYFVPGMGKMLLGWPFIERLDNLFIASYLNGWFGFLSTEQALAWGKLIADWNPFLVWSSLAVELSALFCLWNRRGCMLILVGCMGLHGMICLTTGILFWKWVILDSALIGVLAMRNREMTEMLFAPSRRWLSVGLILAAPLYFDSHWLAWYDTELNEIYHLEAVTPSGKTYNIPRTLLTPYEVYFAQNKFHFLSDEKFINGRYGTTVSWEATRRLDGRPTAAVADAVRNELGKIEFHERKIAAFDRFIQGYFRNLNRHCMRHFIPEILQPPQHIYSVVPEPRYAGQEPVAMVRVIHERSLYQRDRIEILKRDVLREIRIDPPHTPLVAATRH